MTTRPDIERIQTLQEEMEVPTTRQLCDYVLSLERALKDVRGFLVDCSDVDRMRNRAVSQGGARSDRVGRHGSLY